MPGIVTHSRVLKESVDFLSRKKKRNYTLRSIETLLSSREFIRSALFGSIGPNIFDYLPVGRGSAQFGSGISFFLHDGGSDRIIQSMVRIIKENRDFNTSWAAMQRAYLYGYISHMVSDAVFHPFVFYFSGFPVSGKNKDINYAREQNLLFEYNIDIYYQYYNEKSEEYRFSLDDMLPVKKKALFLTLEDPVKTIILKSFDDEFPDIFNQRIFYSSNDSDKKYTGTFGYIDFIPRFIIWTYWIKRTKNRRLADMIKDVRRRNLFYSDFLVRYPWNRKINRDLLNFHRERWQYPAGESGYHYDSVDNLLSSSVEKTVDIWEKIEDSLFSNSVPDIAQLLSLNSYTGEREKKYRDMHIKNPKKISM